MWDVHAGGGGEGGGGGGGRGGAAMAQHRFDVIQMNKG